MGDNRIENGSLWRWRKGDPEEPVCKVLYADERSVAYRAAAGSDPWVGWILHPEDFVRLFEPVRPSAPQVASRWAAGDGSRPVTAGDSTAGSEAAAEAIRALVDRVQRGGPSNVLSLLDRYMSPAAAECVRAAIEHIRAVSQEGGA